MRAAYVRAAAIRLNNESIGPEETTMRRMIVGVCLLALSLASCGDRVPLDSAGTRPRFDLCKHAAIRRQVYVTAIAAADAFAASGRLVPNTVMLAARRQRPRWQC